MKRSFFILISIFVLFCYTSCINVNNPEIPPVKEDIEQIKIYPKGKQETYINGDTLVFTAKTYLSDGSEITGKKVTWSSSGGKIDENGVFTPTELGQFTIKATIDGLSASNSTVIVHGADYLSDAVTIGNDTYTGFSGKKGKFNTDYINFESPSPAEESFSADGFFVLKGKALSDAIVRVKKGEYETFYFINEGEFYQRIWLRFGQGEYKVLISETCLEYYNTGNSKYEGAYKGGSRFYLDGSGTRNLTVFNLHNDSSSDMMYLMPSYICQSDDFHVTNAANAILAELPENSSDEEKLKLLHDWEIHRMYYDNVSVNHPDQRKKQDAVSVIKYQMGVCEGYANLFTAVERVFGIKGRVQVSEKINHAWNNTYLNNKWYIVDSTWDDPITSYSDDYCDIAADRNIYTYFLISTEDDASLDKNHLCPDEKVEVSRSIGSIKVPKMIGMPDGWY